jgi:hypothetical protein
MSSTRRSITGEFHQERFCSAPEFQGDAINGLAAAKRIAIVKDRASREILWWLQGLSLTPGEIQKLCDELVAAFPDRIGSPTLRKLQQGADRELTEKEANAIQKESGICTRFEDWASIFSSERCDYADKSRNLRVSEISDDVATNLRELPGLLVRYCLDPEADIAKGIKHFEDLLGALTILRERSIAAARSRLADTAVTRKINETLDFWYSRRRMVLIEGAAGIGRTYTAKAWCLAHAGLVRYVETPSSNDDRSFYSSFAKALGIAQGLAYNPQQIKLKVEDTLRASGLAIIVDESQYLWPQYHRPRGIPPRMLWLKSLADAGTPFALVAHSDFSAWQEHYVNKTLWTDEQFIRRLNRGVALPGQHSKGDMVKIAQAHFPAGDSHSWKLLAAYARGTEKKQASGIVEALESARYRAELAGRAEPTFDDIEAALIHDHGFIVAKPTAVPRPDDMPAADPLQAPCRRRAKPLHRSAGDSDFPIRVRSRGDRITTPTVAV